jgi:hypothetical protein
VVSGQVVGIWKRMIKKDRVIAETELFNQANTLTKNLIEKASIQYGSFLSKKTEITYT